MRYGGWHGSFFNNSWRQFGCLYSCTHDRENMIFSHINLLVDLICDVLAQLTCRANKRAPWVYNVLVVPLHHTSNKSLKNRIIPRKYIDYGHHIHDGFNSCFKTIRRLFSPSTRKTSVRHYLISLIFNHTLTVKIRPSTIDKWTSF